MSTKTFFGLLLAASSVVATPLVRPVLVARQDFGSCRKQSCEIATIAGSTGATYYPYTTYPTGDTQSGDCCIVRNFPAIKDQLYAHQSGLQAYCQANGGDDAVEDNPPGVSTVSAAPAAATSKARDLEKRVTCTPNILIFAKGTFEPGDTGITVGPALANALNSTLWTTVGVNYDNSLDGDACLGLPGNVNARQVLAQYTAGCPDSNIAMSGYSQGAMVVRNAIARAPSSDVKRVTNVVTFGDPFSGAQIGQYSGPVHVFCMTDDGVCDGELDVGFGHLSYGSDVSPAAAILTASQKTS